MRDILFRGKRVDNGEWIFGGYAKCNNRHYILPDIDLIGKEWVFKNVEVIPETVGQYIGLTDKNGKKIFEGDIVQYQPEYWCEPLQSVVEYCADKWNYPAFGLNDHNYAANGLQCVHEEGGCEVIGNIHDNRKLLEAKE